MPTIGVPELVLIGMILILVFGASRLPKLGEGAGRAVRKILQATRSDERIRVAPPDDGVSDAELVDSHERDGSKNS